ncbi:MAG: hypothetical protein KKC55_01745, partial [Gammaproteobacteria bacterium]|nr:hypothetical protein [Gammaproteobacteria bacterium]
IISSDVHRFAITEPALSPVFTLEVTAERQSQWWSAAAGEAAAGEAASRLPTRTPPATHPAETIDP